MSIIMYSKLATKETVLEVWGASTKHPDATFYYTDYDKCNYFEDEDQLYNWTCFCASQMLFPISAMEMMTWAYKTLITEDAQKYLYDRYIKELPFKCIEEA